MSLFLFTIRLLETPQSIVNIAYLIRFRIVPIMPSKGYLHLRH